MTTQLPEARERLKGAVSAARAQGHAWFRNGAVSVQEVATLLSALDQAEKVLDDARAETLKHAKPDDKYPRWLDAASNLLNQLRGVET